MDKNKLAEIIKPREATRGYHAPVTDAAIRYSLYADALEAVERTLIKPVKTVKVGDKADR